MGLFLELMFSFLCAWNYEVKAEVDNGFTNCDSFFYKQIAPVVPSTDADVSDICQKYQNTYRYATKYSKHWRIPIFSAYELPASELSYRDCNTPQPHRRNTWFVEPQLSHGAAGPADMKLAGQNQNAYKDQQAINIDYSNTGFDRGHLNPNFYHCDRAREATFTLTNAIPQDACFNERTWYRMEVRSKEIMRELCSFPGARRYFVTGVVPRNRMIPNQNHDAESDRLRDYNRVSVPSHMWTAVCCDSSEATNTADQDKGFSFGYYGENRAYSFAFTSSVQDLENTLHGFYNHDIEIFTDDCNANSENSKKALGKINVPVSTMVANSVDNVSTMRGSSVPLKKRALNIEIRKAIKKMKSGDLTLADADLGVRLHRDKVKQFRNKLWKLELTLVLLWTNAMGHSQDSSHIELDWSNEKFSTSSFKNGGAKTRVNDGHPNEKSHASKIKISKVQNKKHFPSSSNTMPASERFENNSVNSFTHPWKDSQVESTDGDVYLVVEKNDKDFTIEGDRCRQNHVCDYHGEKYMWCYTDWANNWDYCCNGLDCSFLNGVDYTRCFVGNDIYGSCSIRSSKVTVSGKRCLHDHECGLHNEGYYWCYTALTGITAYRWDYCCQPSHECDKHGETYKWCYTGETRKSKWRYCYY